MLGSVPELEMVTVLEVRDVAAILGSRIDDRTRVRHLQTDTRRVGAGDVFFALDGERTRGCDHAADALARGARLIVTPRPIAEAASRSVVVPDVTRALAQVASAVRGLFGGPVVGITGSVGKTTVKNVLAALLSGSREVVAAEASFNNAIGVPVTLGRISPSTDVVVVELGTNAPGEIASLAAIARPNVGVLTAIGPSHLAGLGSIQGVLVEKLNLALALPVGAPLIVNADDPVLATVSYPAGLDVVRVGLSPGAEFHPKSYGPGEIRTDDGFRLATEFQSEVLLRNLWIGFCVSRILGIPSGDLAARTATIVSAPLRGERRVVGACELIVDCYNANPLSMAAALKDLGWRRGRKVAVLGEMLELGDATAHHHRELGAAAADVGLERLLLVGPSATIVARAAVTAGMDAGRIWTFDRAESAREQFRSLTAEPFLVLIKGSRGMALERLLESGS